MSTTYTPREGSVVSKVLDFFRANPDEQLDADLISAKCACDRRSVHTLLGPAVQAGMLKRAEDVGSGELVYSVGKVHAAPSGDSPQQAPAAQRAKRKTPAPPFHVDTDTIRIDKNVPLASRQPAMDWTSLFNKLEVGDSFALPLTARSSISAAMNRYKTATGKELTLRVRDGEILRVWRTK